MAVGPWENLGSITRLNGSVSFTVVQGYEYALRKGKIDTTSSVRIRVGGVEYSFSSSSPQEVILPLGLGEYTANKMVEGGYGDHTVFVSRRQVNAVPEITISTTDARTLYENDTINVGGTVRDTDVGNVMMVKYQINNGTTRTIYTTVSDGTAMPFNRVLTFRANKLYDGNNAVTGDLQQGAQHVIKVWAEDDQGGRSADILRTFQVVPNRPASLTIEPIAPISGLIDSDSFTVNGNVSDPDGNTVKVEYKIGGGVYSEIYNGAGGAFSFTVKLEDLNAGNNTISIRATDAYGATTVKSLNVAKSGAVKPLKESIVTYRITPPNGTASGVLLWLERDSGDLVVNVEISMTAADAAESWVPMMKNSTAYVDDSVEEDEWSYEADAPYEKILVRLTMSRTDANSTAGVRLISGVLS